MTDQLRTLAVEVFEADPNAAYPSASNAFVRGFIAGRTSVTGEQMAAVLRRHNFDQLLLGNIEWDGYTAVCACGWSSEECKMPGDAHEAHIEHAVAHVLALMTGLAEGDA